MRLPNVLCAALQGNDMQPNGYVFDGIDAGSLNSGAYML